MRRIARLLLSAALLALPCVEGPARAELCTIDAVPAATLLLPYFEIDLRKFPRVKGAEQTIISIQNAAAAPTIAHVTLWTDLSVPTLNFDVYLTGYDIEEINLTELFFTGEIAGLQTGTDGSRGFVLGTSPSGGLLSKFDLIQAHRGESVEGQCYGQVTRDNRARGYVTIDNAIQFSTLFPNDSGYFGSGSSAVASDENSLWGMVLVSSKKALQADLLVHVEAGSGGSVGPGRYTFYGRYVGFDGSDGREPLGTTWAARYFSGSDKTNIIVWRDSNVEQGPFTCSQLGVSGWYPLDQVQVVAFNEAEDPVELFTDGPGGLEPGFPAETQSLRAVSSAIDTAPFRSGWIYLNLLESSQKNQSFVWVRQAKKSRMALYPGMPYYDDNGGSSPSNVSACGSAPSGTPRAIP